MQEYYPIFGGRSKIHIVKATGNCLCGIRPRRFWECAYGLQVYPEINGYSSDRYAKTDDFRDGLHIAGEHVPKIYFCPKCYAKYLQTLEDQNTPAPTHTEIWNITYCN